MIPVVIDAAIILILIFFIWRGASKGLILTLFGLLAVFVAWIGASLVASALTEPVAGLIRPSIQSAVEEALEDELGRLLPETGAAADDAVTVADFTPSQVLDVLDRADLYTGLHGLVDDAIRDNALKVTTTAAAAVSEYLARLIAGAALFGASFLLISLLWTVLSHALDLAFSLPILDQINTAGGAALGLVKGVVVLLVLVWLGRVSGLLTEANTGPIASIMTVEGLSGLIGSLAARGALSA